MVLRISLSGEAFQEIARILPRGALWPRFGASGGGPSARARIVAVIIFVVREGGVRVKGLASMADGDGLKG